MFFLMNSDFAIGCKRVFEILLFPTVRTGRAHVMLQQIWISKGYVFVSYFIELSNGTLIKLLEHDIIMIA